MKMDEARTSPMISSLLLVSLENNISACSDSHAAFEAGLQCADVGTGIRP